jgi:hypothetical protein
MGDQMSQAEDTNHQHSFFATGSSGDHLNHLSSNQLQAENQQLLKAYQAIKQERDMLNKALHAYFIGLVLPKTL